MKPFATAITLVFVACLPFTACTTTVPPKVVTPAPADHPLRAAIPQIEEAFKAQPERTPLLYVLAMYYERLGEPENVVKTLERLEAAGWTYGVGEYDFTTDTPAFRAMRKRLDAKEPRVSKATRAFTVSNTKDLIPEGIAYDAASDSFFLTSLYGTKIVRVDRSGRMTDFITTGQDGYRAGLGAAVDPQRRLLWAGSGTTPEMRGYTPEQAGLSSLHAYDLNTGKQVRKLTAGSADKPSLLNDVALLADGTLYVTDTQGNRVWRIAPNSDRLESFAEDLRFPNGIAISDDQRYLYVADFRGINRFDLRDNNTRLTLPSKQPLAGIDGLKFHKNTLIGIQNAAGASRVIRVHLDDANRVELLETKNPLFHLPTTGVIAGDEYYFIANSQLRAFTDGKLWPEEKLRDTVVMKIKL
ncbi:MAG TPA: SMP-30/gluconolactonase/LRE family protein [Thermoanaerobaculia bacterium]|jgi:sugar lactone lactonase YvrE